MSEDVKRGAVKMAIDEKVGCVPVLTAICFVGQTLQEDSKLVSDAQTFRYKILFCNDMEELLLDSPEEIAYVLEEFEGTIYDCIRSRRKTILGPTLVHQLAIRGLSPQYCKRPLYNLSMENIGICFNQDTKLFKSEIKWIQSMGGSVFPNIKNNPRVTHLVTDSCRGENFRYASTFGTLVMSGDWIEQSWSLRHEIDFYATNSEFVAANKVKPFHGTHVYLMEFEPDDFGVMASELIRNGGKLCQNFKDQNCTHIVVNDSKTPNIPNELLSSDLPVLKVEWFWTSIQMDTCVDERNHLYMETGWTYFSPGGGMFSPKTPGSGMSLKRKRHMDTLNLNSSKRRLSFNDCVSMSESMLETSDQITPKASSSNLLQVLDSELIKVSVSESRRPKRKDVFNELVQTETNFVNILYAILFNFKKSLEEPEKNGGQLLNQTQLKTIFGNLPPIYDVHSKILAEFNQAQNDWSNDFSIGNVYLKYADDLLKVHRPYLNFFENSKKMLIDCEKQNPRFYAFLRVCQSKPESGRQHLSDLLMRPIQRLPSVELLLKQILSKTKEENPNHPDIKQLDLALNKIKEVLTQNNEDKRRMEGQTKMFEIYSDIEKCPPALVSANRLFLKSVDVVELGSSDKLSGKGSELCLFLFSDVLEVSKKKSSIKSLGLQSPNTSSRSIGSGKTGMLTVYAPGKENGAKSLKHIELMNLTAIKSVVDVTDTGSETGIFALVCQTNDEHKERMFIFQITSEFIDKQEFLKILCQNIGNTMGQPDPDTFLRQMKAEDLYLEPEKDFNLSATYRTLQKVNRVLTFNKSLTNRRRVP